MRFVFEWDENKSKNNLRKHGISFNEILDVFYDPFSLDWKDDVHSTEDETRWQIIGSPDTFLVLVVVYTEHNGIIRLITARKARQKEKAAYYGNIKKTTRGN